MKKASPVIPRLAFFVLQKQISATQVSIPEPGAAQARDGGLR